jgi:hypothetical protein
MENTMQFSSEAIKKTALQCRGEVKKKHGGFF